MYKLTEKIINELTFGEIYDLMDCDGQVLMDGHVADAKYCLLLALQDCESPIERMLAYALENANLHMMHIYNPDVELNDYSNQAEVICGESKYRVDFLITVDYHKLNQRKYFVIECDGHDFHEKTKEQVIKNNNRDRDLINAGYVVLHFSGSEIYKKRPWVCVNEIIKTIISYSKRR